MAVLSLSLQAVRGGSLGKRGARQPGKQAGQAERGQAGRQAGTSPYPTRYLQTIEGGTSTLPDPQVPE